MADTTTRFTAGAIVPDLQVWGGYQRFEFNDHFVKLQAYNKFVPFGGNSSVTSIESLNNNLAGFRFRHVTSPTSPNNYGTFSLNRFDNAADTTGTEIFLYDTGNLYLRNLVFMQENLSMGGKKIVSVATPVAGTDAANKDYVDSMSGGGTVTLTGNVTGSGPVGTPFATTIVSTLDQIPTPTAAVAMGGFKLTGLGTGTLGTDGVNLTQMNTAISAGVSAGTITLTGNVTGSGTVGSSFATTLALRLNQILTPNAAVAMGGFKLTGLGTGTVGTDAVNLTQMNSAISSAVSAGTITLTGNVTGSGTVGSSFATTIASRLNQIPTPTGAVNMNSQNMVSLGNVGIGVASPGVPLQFANVVDLSKIALFRTSANDYQFYGFGVSGGTLRYSVDALVSNHVFYAGASSTTANELFRITGAGNVGIGGVSAPNTYLQFPDDLDNCKISLYQSAANKFQVFGFGISSGTLRYSVGGSSNSHTFYCGASSTTSTELFRIDGTGYATVKGGAGTLYSRVPSIQIHSSPAGATTVLSGMWTKLNGSTAAAPGAVQFTTTNNRITYTGSEVSFPPCYGMVSANLGLRMSAVTSILVGIYKNGSLINASVRDCSNVNTTSSFPVVLPALMVDVEPGDYFEVWASTLGATVTIVALSLSFDAC